MEIEYLHASKYGNGARVAEEFRSLMAARGIPVAVGHIRDADPTDLPHADLYVFSSPGRMGRPIRRMRRFLERLTLPAGTRYALLTTEMASPADREGDATAAEATPDRSQRVRPVMREILDGKHLVAVAEERVLVLDIKGPLEDGWEATVERFAARLPLGR